MIGEPYACLVQGVHKILCSCLDHKWQVEHQRCRSSGRVQKIHNILGKNTIFDEHPVYISASCDRRTMIVINGREDKVIYRGRLATEMSIIWWSSCIENLKRL